MRIDPAPRWRYIEGVYNTATKAGTMKKTFLLPAVLLSLAAFSACTPTVAVRGNLLEPQALGDVQPGVDTQADVMRKLGSPTTKAPFDENVWYYLGQRTEKNGILDPKITEERIVRLTFNQKGILDHAEDVSGHREDIPYSREKTQTSGNDITVLQQLLGNMGRFNKADEGGSGGIGSPGR